MYYLEKFNEKFLFGFFTRGHARTLRAKKNIAASFIIKGLNIAVGLALVPLAINYLSPTKYGLWITISSIIGWFGFFDIGFGHGLRNRFAEALATGKHELAKIYVSTTYAILSLIIITVLFVFYIINPFLNWNIILNAGTEVVLGSELSLLAFVVFTFFCLRFIFKLISTILIADQKPAKASFFDLLGKIIALLVIYVLTKTTEGSLIYLGVAISTSPVLVLLISSVWFYNGRYKAYKPSVKCIDLTKAPDIINLGFKFFIIQIAAILLYKTNTIIIAQLFGPEQVTQYHIAFKYFTVLMMGFSIIKTPFWSAFTEAWTKKEIVWIKNIMTKLMLAWFLFMVCGTVMLIFSKWIFLIWIGDKVYIPYSISALVGVWVLLNAWNGIFSTFLNGVGKVKLQMYLGVTAAFVNVPLAIYFGKNIGIEGVLIANLLVISIGVWLYPLQYQKIISGTAKGIFNR